MRLTYNLRFYILAGSILLSLAVAAGLRLMIPSDQLFWIRSQQIYGLLAVAMLYVAIILTPLSKLLPKRGYMSNLLFARRAIGVSAAYFAGLHMVITLVDQLGGLSGLALLPVRFKVSLVLAAVAMLVLFLMAVTSFDRVIKFMTFPRWKLLHRFVYLAGVLVIVHVWLIGTHMQYAWIGWVSFAAIALLCALESIRIGLQLTKKFSLDSESRLAVIALVLGLMLGALLALPLFLPNIHVSHNNASDGHGHKIEL